MRVFIGIETGSAQQELWGAATYIANLSGGRPAKKSNIHLTVKFLGEVADIRGIKQAMDHACKTTRDFYMELDELVFMSRLKIVWCSVKGDLKALSTLQSGVEDALAGAGFPREKRPFLPHITLVRDAYKKWDMRDVRLENKIFKVSRLVLFQSVRQNGELLYIPLHISEFGVTHG
jgi:2'-5' RNA ligase